MSEHRPTVTLECDVFSDTDEPITPELVAELAWSNIRDWVANGYQPVVTVIMDDNTTHKIDLEEVTWKSL